MFTRRKSLPKITVSERSITDFDRELLVDVGDERRTSICPSTLLHAQPEKSCRKAYRRRVLQTRGIRPVDSGFLQIGGSRFSLEML
ncbi:hypothetical protein K7X08_027737 [Anisodus acutangulus]|uniref:Uncharacterized protein n=1 Tax=Anisodus acutangulus TaxID=402998 RepID=A0A9Q1LJG0_9SOLA|nr:hypothetical protein K7X08_027737 [Anisodus acutangulus]